jgi:hypothetical protein
MLRSIKLHYFLISFAVGLFLVYVFHPPPTVVVKFPSPYNAGKVVYEDKNNSCYKYKADRVDCPKDKSLVKPQPLFEDFSGRAFISQS